MTEAEDALRHHLRTANDAAKEVALALGSLRRALDNASGRSEQIAVRGQPDFDRGSRLLNAMESGEEMSAELTRLMKAIAPLCRDAVRGPQVAKSR